MKPYAPPKILAILIPEKAPIPREIPEPSPETVKVLVNHRIPEPPYMKQYLRDQLAETFPFKRKGYRKHVK